MFRARNAACSRVITGGAVACTARLPCAGADWKLPHEAPDDADDTHQRAHSTARDGLLTLAASWWRRGRPTSWHGGRRQRRTTGSGRKHSRDRRVGRRSIPKFRRHGRRASEHGPHGRHRRNWVLCRLPPRRPDEHRRPGATRSSLDSGIGRRTLTPRQARSSSTTILRTCSRW